MPILSDLRNEFIELEELLEDAGGDLSDPRIDEAITQRVQALAANMMAKSDGYAAYIRDLRLREDAINAEIARLKRSAQSKAALRERLSTRLMECMRTMGLNRIGGRIYTVTIKANGGHPPVIILDDQAAIRAGYVRVVESVDKEAIREAIAHGESVPFARLGERGIHLHIS